MPVIAIPIRIRNAARSVTGKAAMNKIILIIALALAGCIAEPLDPARFSYPPAVVQVANPPGTPVPAALAQEATRVQQSIIAGQLTAESYRHQLTQTPLQATRQSAQTATQSAYAASRATASRVAAIQSTADYRTQAAYELLVTSTQAAVRATQTAISQAARLQQSESQARQREIELRTQRRETINKIMAWLPVVIMIVFILIVIFLVARTITIIELRNALHVTRAGEQAVVLLPRHTQAEVIVPVPPAPPSGESGDEAFAADWQPVTVRPLEIADPARPDIKLLVDEVEQKLDNLD